MSDIVMRDDARRPDLDQQRKRARDLQQGVRRGDPAAIARMLAHHPKARGLTPREVADRLASRHDAQLVLARELGLPSWPALKEHAERLARARTAIAAGTVVDTDLPTLHIRCGSDIRERLRQAGFVGAFLECSDPLCQGPVPRDGDLLQARAGFIADAYGMAPDAALAKLAAEHAGLEQAAATAGRIALWFEHDPYDQLLLARVLASLARQRPVEIVLVEAGRYPGLTRFIGLGQLEPPALRTLWEQRRPIGPGQLRLGTAVWRALREPTPVRLHALAAGGTPELPAMAAALRRHLQELPWTGDGLSLTQRLALLGLRDGPRTAGEIFTKLHVVTEPLPFLGDLMFWAVLRELIALADAPVAVDAADVDLPWHRRRLALTAAGQAILAGRLDLLALAPPVRWLGGVRLDPATPCWRWDPDRVAPVLAGQPAR